MAALCAFWLCAPAAVVQAQEPQAAPKQPDAAVPAEAPVSITRHVVEADGKALAYKATAGMLALDGESGDPRGRIFFVAYEMDGAPAAERPLTFAFNGGPGAASAYLHLGALGPRAVVLNGDGTVPPPPARLADNELTWLAFTDLVFVDPVGTGFSRGLPAPERGEEGGGESRPAFWGPRQDAEALSRFVRLYLTRRNRWLSPKFLVGESYGGFRAATLAALLPSRHGIGLNGVVLISPALEFSFLARDDYRLLPWVLPLPSFAAAARHHGRAIRPETGEVGPRAALREVEAFSLSGMLAGIAQGASLAPPEREALYRRLSGYTGLPLDVIGRARGRISRGLFAKTLLRDSARLVSAYDASIAVSETDPVGSAFGGRDPTLAALSALLTTAFNSYVREELAFETDLPYRILNHEVSRRWDWESDVEGSQGFAGAADDLKEGMTLNRSLRVLIAHGVYDLVTPYLGSIFAANQMALDEAIRPNLTLKVYEGGHMPYTHAPAREQLYRDARNFYRRAVR